MAVNYDPVKMAMTMMESALHILDDAGERDAALQLAHALSHLKREPVPQTLEQAREFLGAALSRVLLDRIPRLDGIAA